MMLWEQSFLKKNLKEIVYLLENISAKVIIL